MGIAREGPVDRIADRDRSRRGLELVIHRGHGNGGGLDRSGHQHHEHRNRPGEEAHCDAAGIAPCRLASHRGVIRQAADHGLRTTRKPE